MMIQSKRRSLLEAVINVMVGLFINWVSWFLIIIPIFKIYPSSSDIILISIIFTIISIARSYIIRRIFNKIK